MAENDPVVLSVVVMHHPRRSDRIPALLAACRPLDVRVIADPEPEGPPSPLRTAKRAWAAIAPGATHHVVLQDDILPMAGFADHLHRALAARPEAGVTLSVQQTSPRNSYAVRRAALAGRAFTDMSRMEWTPTLAFALPVARAEALAGYLAGLPDFYVDDDHLVTQFCNEQAIAVVATVPNLVEHADVVSLSLYADEGRRPVTVYDEHWTIPPGWWVPAGRPPLDAPERSSTGLAVELRESRCGLRRLAATVDEPLEHPFTWEWRDRAALAGVQAEQIVARWRDTPVPPDLRDVPAALTLEVWAAGFLLGADLPRPAGPVTGSEADAALAPRLRRRAVQSWLGVGLAERDRRRLTPSGRAALVDLTLAAVAVGAQAPPPPVGTAVPPAPEGLEGFDGVLRRMAGRESAVLLEQPRFSTWVLAPAILVSVRPRPCPWCHATAGTVDPAGLEPLDTVRMLRPDEPDGTGATTLHVLACEWLTARSLLPLVSAVQDGHQLPAHVLTRSAATAEILARDPTVAALELLSEVDDGESWLPGPTPNPSPQRPEPSSGAERSIWVLPASSRLAPPATQDAGHRDLVGSYILTPHLNGLVPTEWEERYRRYRDRAFDGPTKHSSPEGISVP